MNDDYDDDFLDEFDDLDELSELDLEDDYHLELPLEELDDDSEFKAITEKPSLAETEQLLRLGKNLKPAQYPSLIYGLSDLSQEEATSLRPAWRALETTKRRDLTQQLIDAVEINYLLDYRSIALMAIEDEDPQVRASAVELLWDDESLEVMHKLVHLVRHDKGIEVRASAFTGLGRFILLGEYDEVPKEEIQFAQTAAYDSWKNLNEPVEVRRRALEAFSNCTDDRLPEMITEAYKSHLPEMRVSAIYAMGRSYDSQWTSTILREMDNENPQIRYEAVRAAGELEIKQAVQQLGKLARGEHDREIMLMAIWSLGEIGGELPTKILQRLSDKAEESDDEDLIDAIDEAIAIASLGSIDII
ncbi:MAG: HEAT repeat domain-containing protein [bacterium]|nr:HEAT repeat domain-containing protein [bacterium]